MTLLFPLQSTHLTKMGHTAATAEPDQLGEGELGCYICKEVVISFLSIFQGTATSFDLNSLSGT